MSDDLVKMCKRLSKYAHAQLSSADLERIANRIAVLEAENAILKQMWWDANDVTELAGTIADLESKLATARRDAASIARSFSCCHVPDEIAALIAQEDSKL